MRVALLAYCAGIMAASLLLHPAAQLVPLALASLILSALRCCCPKSWHHAVSASLALCLGLTWHMCWASTRLQERLPAPLEGRDMGVVALIDSLPTRTARATVVEAEILHSGFGWQGRRVRLSDFQGLGLAPGQRWQLTVRLKRPHGRLNPGGFDSEAWLLQNGIAATGYIREHSGNRLLNQSSGGVTGFRFRLREHIRAVAKPSQQGILQALILGDRSDISAAQWELFSATGTNHLFVISGLHIGMIAVIGFAAVASVYGLAPGLALYLPRQRAAAYAAVLFASAYAALADFSLPTQRALVMLVATMLGSLLARPIAASLRLQLGLAVVLSLNPLAAMSLGFWLSFLAVGVLLYSLGRTGNAGPASSTQTVLAWFAVQARSQWVVFLALLLPLGIALQQVPLLAPLLNFIAIPIVGLLVVPISLTGAFLLPAAPALAAALLSTAGMVLDGLFALMTWVLAELPVALVRLPLRLSLHDMIFLLPAILLLLAPRGLAQRLLVFPLCLPVLLPRPDVLPAPAFRVHILDVGQGLAVVLQTEHHTLLYDTGPGQDRSSNSATAVILPALSRLGVTHLDKVVISHGDNDHAGGLIGLVGKIPIGEIVSSQTELSEATAKPCRAGDGWRWDGLRFAFLHPEHTAAGGNNDSCVLMIRSPNSSILLPGDIDRRVERRLAATLGADLAAQLLLAPHHGSRTSSSFPFIKMVDPDFVVFAAGYRNAFSHPAAEIEARYRLFDVLTLNTGMSGMISFESTVDGSLSAPRRYRARARRYWRASAFP